MGPLASGRSWQRRATRFACMGFTLIELLVVITVMSILASIVLPVLGRVREVARRTKCSHNLRQIGMAFSLYAEEYRGLIPYETTVGGHWYPWNGYLQTYGRQTCLGTLYPDYLKDGHIFFCPGPNYPQYEAREITTDILPYGDPKQRGMDWAHFIKYRGDPAALSRCNYLCRYRWGTDGVMGNYGVDVRECALPDVLEQLSGYAAVFDTVLGRVDLGLIPHQNGGYNILYYDGPVLWLPNPDPSVFPTRNLDWVSTVYLREDFLEIADHTH